MHIFISIQPFPRSSNFHNNLIHESPVRLHVEVLMAQMMHLSQWYQKPPH